MSRRDDRRTRRLAALDERESELARLLVPLLKATVDDGFDFFLEARGYVVIKELKNRRPSAEVTAVLVLLDELQAERARLDAGYGRVSGPLVHAMDEWASFDDEHRLGPRRLAMKLLQELQASE